MKEIGFWNGIEYRIKPEPKYRPFANAKECWKEMPERFYCVWKPTFCEYKNRVYDYVEIPKGSIKKLIERELSWSDEPVELK